MQYNAMVLIEYLREHYAGYDAKAFSDMHSDMKKLGIRASYESFEIADKTRRVIFSSSGQRRITEMSSEANGLILLNTAGKWSPLVIPPRTLRSNIDANFVSENFDKFEIRKVRDGTIINMYWYDGWRIATTKGYDVTDIRWSRQTYGQILAEVLENVGFDLYEKLDKARSYTFGFKHPEFHPFDDGKRYDFWFVQSVVVEEEKFNPTNPGVDFPMQEMAVVDSLRTMFRNLKGALQSFLDDGDVNFGYIMRCSDVPVEHSSMLLESSLLQKIRNLHYGNRLVYEANQLRRDRNRHIIIKAFLNPHGHELFIKLFPVHTPTYRTLQSIANDLVKSTVLRFNMPKTAKKLESMPKDIQKWGMVLREKFETESNLRPGSENFKQAIASFVIDDAFNNIFYSVLEGIESSDASGKGANEPKTAEAAPAEAQK